MGPRPNHDQLVDDASSLRTINATCTLPRLSEPITPFFFPSVLAQPFADFPDTIRPDFHIFLNLDFLLIITSPKEKNEEDHVRIVLYMVSCFSHNVSRTLSILTREGK